MKEIIQTLLIAIALVILVVYLFLQDWRATLIPLPRRLCRLSVRWFLRTG